MLLPELLLFAASPLLIHLSSGTFRGLTVNGTDRWLGIPYAQPPVGPLRFKAPLAISPPSPGIQDASHLSHACPQPTTTLSISEDCLYLNVWRPQNTSSIAGLPVMVWIHGGAYNIGSASDPAFDGTRTFKFHQTLYDRAWKMQFRYCNPQRSYKETHHFGNHELSCEYIWIPCEFLCSTPRFEQRATRPASGLRVRSRQCCQVWRRSREGEILLCLVD